MAKPTYEELEREVERLQRVHGIDEERIAIALARAEELEGYVAALRAEPSRKYRDAVDIQLATANTRLAAATKLLEQVWHSESTPGGIDEEIGVFLTNAPAAPTHSECVSGYVGTNGECNDCGKLDCDMAAPTCDCSPADMWECSAQGCPAKKPTRSEAAQGKGAAPPDHCEHCGLGIWNPDHHRIHQAGRHCKGAPTRTDHERAVLDAMAAYVTHWQSTQGDDEVGVNLRCDAIAAELARRESEK